MKIKYIYSILILLLMTRCSKVLNDGIPSYIYIDQVKLSTTNLTQGNNSFAANSIWLEVGGQDMGAWQLPARIPILQQGKATLRIFAGIPSNAILTFGKYNFTDFYEEEVTLVNGQIDTIIPIVKYKDNVKIAYMEDFENTLSINNIAVISNPVVDGREKNYGKISINTSNSDREIRLVNNNEIAVPVGKEAILEFDYSSDNDTSVVFANLIFEANSANPILIGSLKCSKTWKRVYFPIAELVGPQGGATFKLMWALIRKDDQTEASFKIDNIKIIHQ